MKHIARRMVIVGLLSLLSACGGTGPMNVDWLENAPAIIQDSQQSTHSDN